MYQMELRNHLQINQEVKINSLLDIFVTWLFRAPFDYRVSWCHQHSQFKCRLHTTF